MIQATLPADCTVEKARQLIAGQLGKLNQAIAQKDQAIAGQERQIRQLAAEREEYARLAQDRQARIDDLTQAVEILRERAIDEKEASLLRTELEGWRGIATKVTDILAAMVNQIPASSPQVESEIPTFSDEVGTEMPTVAEAVESETPTIRVCSIPWCQKPREVSSGSHDLCSTHHGRLKVYGDPLKTKRMPDGRIGAGRLMVPFREIEGGELVPE